MTYPLRIASSLALALLLGVTARVQAAQLSAFEVTSLSLPAAGDSAQPDLVSSADGSLYLSWVVKLGKVHRLRFSRVESAGDDRVGGDKVQWLPAQTVAQGDDWFVNWADTPHLVVFSDGTLWAHWLRKNGSALYDYGVALVRSADQGRTWSNPIRLEPEGARLDYGFVSLWEQGSGSLGIAWLDSRQKQASNDNHGEHHEHAGGSMMLRAANFDKEGKRTAEWALDSDTCDCCPTSAAMTADGAVLAYRGRTKDEIRDIQLVRFDGTNWARPITVHADRWKFAGCPVNGPSVVARGDDVWVAWYTEGEGHPSVRLAHSSDAGRHFGTPQNVAEGSAQLGRVDMAMDANNLWITWMVESRQGNAQQLMLARFDASTGKLEQRGSIADLSARGHASGLPKIQLRDGEAWLVWTDEVKGKSQLSGVRVRAK